MCNNRRMRNGILALAIVLTVLPAAHAQSGAELEKARGCGACHAPAATKIGPSYADIANRYRSDTAAAERLATLLKEGKRHPRVTASDTELRALVAYVLSAR